MTPRSPAAFKLLQDRPYDIVVSTRPPGAVANVRRFWLYCAEEGRVSSFRHDIDDPAYAGDRKKMLRAAVRMVLQEVKSRTLANRQFLVWFQDEAARRVVEMTAAELAGNEPLQARSLEKMVLHSRTVGEGDVPKR